MNHTPGPWSCETYAIYHPEGLTKGHGIYGDQHLIAEIEVTVHNQLHAKGDARLMASALLMLETLKLSLGYLESYYGKIHFITSTVEKAIAKAEGKG